MLYCKKGPDCKEWSDSCDACRANDKFVQFGRPPKGQGARSDIMDIKSLIDGGASMADIAESNFPQFLRNHRGFSAYKLAKAHSMARSWNTDIIVYWGPPGSGKSSHVAELAPSAYWVPPPGPNGSIWFDGYDGHADIVIDEFYGWIKRDFLCRLGDRYPLLIPVKGDMVNFVGRRIFITSNQDPKDWYPKVGLGALTRRMPFVYYVDYSADFPCITCGMFPHVVGCARIAAVSSATTASKYLAPGYAPTSADVLTSSDMSMDIAAYPSRKRAISALEKDSDPVTDRPYSHRMFSESIFAAASDVGNERPLAMFAGAPLDTDATPVRRGCLMAKGNTVTVSSSCDCVNCSKP